MRQLKNFNVSGDKKNENISGEPVIPSIDKYEGMSRDQLIDSLKRAVISAKRDEKYDPETVENFCNFVSPMLDDEGRTRLKEVMAMLENE